MAQQSYECPMCGYYGILENGRCPMCGHEIFQVIEVVKTVKKPRKSLNHAYYGSQQQAEHVSGGYYQQEIPKSRSRGHRTQKTPYSAEEGNSNWALKAVAIVIILILLLYYLPLWYPMLQHYTNTAKEMGTPKTYRKYPRETEFTMKRVNMFNVKGGEIEYEYHTPFAGDIPKDGSIQDIIDHSIVPPPSSGTYSDWEFMVWQGRISSQFSIEITYHAKVKTVQWNIDESVSGTVDMIPQSYKNQYVKNQWAVIDVDTDNDGVPDSPSDKNNDGIPDKYKIEIDNPEIVAKANEIVGNDTNVYSILKKIYLYMTRDGGFTYITGREGLPARCVDTLRSKVGDCDDQSILFASLARAKGVPVWLVLGWLYDPKTGTWGGHGWLNAYIPLKDGGDVIVTIDVVNKEFLFRDAYRLTEWTDNGQNGYWDGGKWIPGALHYYYNAFTYIYRGYVQVSHDEEAISVQFNEIGEIKYYDVGTTGNNEGRSNTRYQIPMLGIYDIIIAMVCTTIVFYVIRRVRWHNNVKS